MAELRLVHATLLVKDLEEAQRFYETVLGLTLSPERNLSFEGCWYQIGDVQLHLIQSEQLIQDLVRPDKWGLNRHIAFNIPSFDSMRQKIEAAGYQYQSSSSGRKALFVQDPAGNIIELSEMS